MSDPKFRLQLPRGGLAGSFLSIFRFFPISRREWFFIKRWFAWNWSVAVGQNHYTCLILVFEKHRKLKYSLELNVCTKNHTSRSGAKIQIIFEMYENALRFINSIQILYRVESLKHSKFEIEGKARIRLFLFEIIIFKPQFAKRHLANDLSYY